MGWIAGAVLLAMSSLSWYCIRVTDKLEQCSQERVDAEKSFSTERERIIREQITFYQSLLQRIDAVEKKRKK